MTTKTGTIWIKMAVAYLVVGVGLGIYMGASGDHSMHPVHAHLNLLGWASMALIGLIYRQFPAAAATGLAKAQFWLHQLALPVMMVALIGLLRGNAAFDPVIGVGSMVMGLAVALFAVNVFKHVKD